MDIRKIFSEYRASLLNIAAWLIAISFCGIFASVMKNTSMTTGLVPLAMTFPFKTQAGAEWCCAAFWVSLFILGAYWGLPHLCSAFGRNIFVPAVAIIFYAFCATLLYGASDTEDWLACIGGVVAAIAGALLQFLFTRLLLAGEPPSTLVEHLIFQGVHFAAAHVALWPMQSGAAFVTNTLVRHMVKNGNVKFTFVQFGLPQLLIFLPYLFVSWRAMSPMMALMIVAYCAGWTREGETWLGFVITYMVLGSILFIYNLFVYWQWTTRRMTIKTGGLANV